MDTLPLATLYFTRKSAAEADAALMNGHDSPAARVASARAAEADAALMNGHWQTETIATVRFEAAEADAALMNGHGAGGAAKQTVTGPRRPTRP